MRRLPHAALVAICAAALLGGGAPAAGAARGLTTGFYDLGYIAGDPGLRAGWLDSSTAVGARVVRLGPTWAEIAPAERPASFDPTNPADPAYRWRVLDDAVRDAAARGLQPLVTLWNAPSWAEGPGRPASAPPGTWKPSAAQLGKFARAAARRYSGGFPDPDNPGRRLPRVRMWQVLNEPNLDVYLTPQWVRRHGHWRTASPAIYRGLLNAAYAGIKSVQPHALVATAGTAPYGDLVAGGHRLPPARFVRELLCFRDRALRPSRCRHPAHFDVLAHHPYAVAGPARHALNADDVAVPDLAKLTRPLRRAERTGRVLPRKRKRLWVTEISWDSNPPDPDGVPAARHARWLDESLYRLWRQGVDTVLWFQVRDAPPDPDFASTYQSGVFLRDGSAKPAARAFAFPFVALRAGHGRMRVWGRAPAAGSVAIQQLRGGTWTSVAHRRPSKHTRIFSSLLSLSRHGSLRALSGTRASIAWPGP